MKTTQTLDKVTSLQQLPKSILVKMVNFTDCYLQENNNKYSKSSLIQLLSLYPYNQECQTFISNSEQIEDSVILDFFIKLSNEYGIEVIDYQC